MMMVMPMRRSDLGHVAGLGGLIELARQVGELAVGALALGLRGFLELRRNARTDLFELVGVGLLQLLEFAEQLSWLRMPKLDDMPESFGSMAAD